VIKSSRSGSVSVTYTDNGLGKLFAELAALSELVLSVGLLGSERYPGGESVATVGAILEFGSEHNPARPWMRRAVIRNAPRIEAAQAHEYTRVALGEQSAVDALAAVGKLIAELMIDSIDTASAWAMPNTADTISAKSTTSPLRATGKLRSSISWQVATKDGAVKRRGKP